MIDLYVPYSRPVMKNLLTSHCILLETDLLIKALNLDLTQSTSCIFSFYTIS